MEPSLSDSLTMGESEREVGLFLRGLVSSLILQVVLRFWVWEGGLGPGSKCRFLCATSYIPDILVHAFQERFFSTTGRDW